MKNKPLFVFVFCVSFTISYSQQSDSTYINYKNGISKPSLLATHPFGIFFTRIQGNFKTRPNKKTTINLSIESGNVWSAPITAYIPNDEALREQVRQIPWHGTEFAFNVDEIDAKRINLSVDGVLKGFRANLAYKINAQSEFNFGIRTFMLTKGKAPFTLLTGDQFIEGFHDNIAGGNDPFARRLFGLDKAKILYTDRNNNTLEINNGDFFIGGFETSYYYYPQLSINSFKNFYINFGAHLGINLSKYNASLDFGISTNILKTYALNDLKYFQFGLSIGVLRKNGIEFKTNNIDFGTNKYLGYLENIIEYNFISKRKTTHSFGIDFYLQTSLNKKDEFEYIIPIRNGVSEKAWITGISNLYKNNNYWTFLYSFTRKTVTTTFYLQQDLNVNNNPDIQTGASITFGLK